MGRCFSRGFSDCWPGAAPSRLLDVVAPSEGREIEAGRRLLAKDKVPGCLCLDSAEFSSVEQVSAPLFAPWRGTLLRDVGNRCISNTAIVRTLLVEPRDFSMPLNATTAATMRCRHLCHSLCSVFFTRFSAGAQYRGNTCPCWHRLKGRCWSRWDTPSISFVDVTLRCIPTRQWQPCDLRVCFGRLSGILAAVMK